MDQGILALMNEARPGCEANQDYARWAQETGKLKSVPKNQQCPAGYTMLDKNNKLYSNSLYDTCKLTNTTATDVPPALLTRVNACVYGGGAPAPASSGLPQWVIILLIIIAISLPVLVGIAMFRKS